MRARTFTHPAGFARTRALALAAVLTATAAAAIPQPVFAAAPSPRISSDVTLNFVGADIEAVTRAIAVMINRQILVDPRVKGIITVYSEQPLPVREAYLNYLAALRGLGFTVVDNAGLLKVVPEADAKLQAGTVSVDTVGQRGDQVITQIFRLTHENPNNLISVLRPLISPNNTINANPSTNTLVITDYADNLQRIARIIAALDQSPVSDVEVVPLRFAVASDLVPLLQKLSDGGGAAAAGVTPGGSVSVIADARANTVILRAPNPARLANLRALVEKLDQPTASGPAGSIHVVYLKNADATRLAAVLRAAFGSGGSTSTGSGSSAAPPSPTNLPPGVSAAATTPIAASAQPSTGGFVQADPATNSLIITAVEPLYRQIRGVIDQLDTRRAQVYVESMIVEMSASKAAEFGFQWQGLVGSKGDRYGVAAGTNFGGGGNNIVNLSVAGGNTSGTASTLPGTGLNVGLLQKINGVYTLASLARFLETVSGTNILSTPNLVSLDNEEAKIVVGKNVPFVTGSFTNTGSSSGSTVNPFQTVERKDVGITLRVRPQIGEGGAVRMTIYQEKSSVDQSTAGNQNGPTTTKSSIESNVVVDDGQILVLGGQLTDQYDDGQSKVPGLGDVPLFGNLFRSETRSRDKTNLLVFLRPVVLRDGASAQALTLDRYDAIRAQQQQAQPQPNALLPIDGTAVLPPVPGSVRPATAPSPATVPQSSQP